MQQNKTRNIQKIIMQLMKIGKLPKAIIKYGSLAFLLLFAIGTAIIVVNHTVLNYDSYVEFVATSIIKNSFIILAEAVIGGLLIDYIFAKN